MRVLVLLLELLVLGFWHAAAVDVSDSAELLAALQSTAEEIVLLNDVAMGPEFEQFDNAPLVIRRNVTLTGLNGSRSTADDMPVIDLQNRVGVLELCSTCTFRLAWVNVANENRAGTGGGISAFRGLPGSRVDWVGGVGLRLACPPTASALSLLMSTQRSSLFPGQNQAGSTNFTYRGKFYPDMLAVRDLSTDVVPQQLTNASYTGGYAIRRRNATRLCEHIVSNQCLQVRLPEDCIAELLAGGSRNNNSSSSSGSGAGPDTLVVPVAVPAAIGSALLAAAVGFLIWRRRRVQRRRLQRAGDRIPPPPLGGAAVFGLDPAMPDRDRTQGQPSAGALAASPPGLTSLQQPAVGGDGSWELLWSSSAPNAHRAALQDDIELGVLLGAGSFARCYKGRWLGLDVAVKVIHHNRDTAQAVASEVQLMLNLNHPNIVRAYHCITRQMQAGAADTTAPQQHGWGSAAAATAVVGAFSPTFPTPAAPSSAPGSIGGPGSSSGLQTPSAAAAAAAEAAAGGRFPSWNPQLKQLQRQQQQQQQQQQPANVAVPPDQGSTASYVPFVGVRPVSSSGSQPLDRTSAIRQASASTAASGVSTAALAPATPGCTGELGLHGSRPASAANQFLPTTPTTGSTQAGVLSSGGLSLLAQDLDPSVLPVYQRRQSYQQGQQLLSPLHSLASGSADRLSAASTALGTTTGSSIATATDMPAGPSAAASGLAPAATGVAAGPSLLPGNPGQGQVASLSGSANRSQLASSPAALPAPGSSGLATVSAISSGSAAGSSRPWHIMGTSSLSEVQPASESGSDEGQQSQLAGGWGSGRRLLARQASVAMCETWLVLELCDRGTLARQASGWEPEHNEQDMLRLLHLLRDVACGLKLLQTQHIVHADLNAHNVLVASSSVARHGLVAKLGDFGLSRSLKLHTTHRTTGTVGMLTHQPPELLQDGRMSPAVDIYSFGILMYEVFTRQAAYEGLRIGQIYHQVVVLGDRPSVPPDMPEDYELIMRRCWATDPTERPSVDMLLECLDLMIEDRLEQQA